MTRRPRPGLTLPAFSRVYFPVSTPARSGDQGATPSPSSRAIGNSSPSTVRSISEYSICSATSGVQPRQRASTCAWAVFHAGVSENPM